MRVFPLLSRAGPGKGSTVESRCSVEKPLKLAHSEAQDLQFSSEAVYIAFDRRLGDASYRFRYAFERRRYFRRRGLHFQRIFNRLSQQDVGLPQCPVSFMSRQCTNPLSSFECVRSQAPD